MASIFHYTSMPTLIEKVLPTFSLLTNSLRYTNDPRESQRWSFGSTNLPLEKIFPDYYSDDTHIACQIRFGQMIKDELQVVCFSGATNNGWDNEMMWAHYCQNHCGVCLELDEEAFLSSVKNLKSKKHYLEAVNYSGSSKSPWINWDLRFDTETNINNIVERWYKDIAFRKSHFWEKEDEKRLVLQCNERTLIPIKSSLKAIYFGLNFSHHYLPAIESLISDIDIKLYDVIYQHYRYERWERKLNSKQIPIARKYN